MKSIIIYKSKYGSSQQYALWIADALQSKAENIESISIRKLQPYDVVIYVGGIYAGKINGFKKISKNLDELKNKKILLCMVGMTNPDDQKKYQQVFVNNVPEQYRDIVKSFALRGNQLISKMSGMHRFIMKFPKSMIEKIPVEERTAEDNDYLAHFGEDRYFVHKDYISDIISYAGVPQ